MKYNLLYLGPKPPSSYDGLKPIAVGLDDAGVAVLKAQAETDQGVECFAIVDSGYAIYAWKKASAPTPVPDPVPPTTKQQIIDQIAALKQLADQLP